MKRLNARISLAVSLVMMLLLSMMDLHGSIASEYPMVEEPVINPLTCSISLDVNPSIELKIENGTVTQSLAYNDDGQSLLKDIAVSGLTPEEAVKAITKALVEGGYLTLADENPYLVITVSGAVTQEEDTVEALQDAAKQVSEDLGMDFEVKSTFVSDDVVAQAAAVGLSTGKFLLMKYIANTEGISLEEAIAKYGSAKIGDLMDQFKDAEDLFDNDGLVLTEEQRKILDAAFQQQKDSIKAAESTFHDAFKDLKNTYREKVHSATKTLKEGDSQVLVNTLNQLKEQMLAEYQTVRQALDSAVSTARSTFLEAVTAAGIPGEVSDQYYNWHMNKELNTEGELKAFLKEFDFKDVEKKDKGEDKNKDRDEGKDEDKGKDRDGDKDEDKGKDRDGDKDKDRNEDKEEDQGSSNSGKGKK